MSGPLTSFRAKYAAMLDLLMPVSVRLQVCTIYTAIPFEEQLWRAFAPIAIGAFNRVILEEAGGRGISVLRFDELCNEADDYSASSPIEPSAKGGQKIADLILASLAKS